MVKDRRPTPGMIFVDGQVDANRKRELERQYKEINERLNYLYRQGLPYFWLGLQAEDTTLYGIYITD